MELEALLYEAGELSFPDSGDDGDAAPPVDGGVATPVAVGP